MRASREDRFWIGMLLAVTCFTFGVEAHWNEADAERERSREVPAPVEAPAPSYEQVEDLIYIAQHFEAPPAEWEGEDPDEPLKIEVALVEQGYLREDVPLNYTLQDVLQTECEINHIPYCVGLGLIEVESSFREDAVNEVSGCYGLCQLNQAFFPAGLSSVENIRTGMAYLGEQLERHGGDMWAALTAYNAGYDTGNREYAEKVMEAAERWMNL